MVAEAAEISGDLEQLRRRFEEFRARRSGRSRFPEALLRLQRQQSAMA
jgi:hypothetical protein